MLRKAWIFIGVAFPLDKHTSKVLNCLLHSLLTRFLRDRKALDCRFDSYGSKITAIKIYDPVQKP